MDIIEQAKEFGINAHSRINHRRKYTKQPYSVHLSAVAHLVASVTDDTATIATAWLHDVVEDTTATLLDVEKAFGKKLEGTTVWVDGMMSRKKQAVPPLQEAFGA